MAFNYRVDRARLTTLSLFYALLSLILLARLVILQVWQYPNYQQKSAMNLKALLYEPAFRGQIFDREGRLLSANERHWDLYIDHGTEKTIKQLLESLRPLWGEDLTQSVWQRAATQPLFEPLLVKRSLTPEEMAHLSPWLSRHPVLQLKERSLRSYPYGASCAHLIGYTQPERLFRHHRPEISSERPIVGLEARYDHLLKGQPSKISVSKNAQNHCIDKERVRSAESGQDLQLSINARWQQQAYELLASRQICGSIIVLDVHTGEILVSASAPSFDPEKIRYEPALYHHDMQRPLFYRAFKGLYPPASLIKPFIAIAALEEGMIQPQTHINDPGYYQPQGSSQRFHDWKKRGHGPVNVQKAIAQSCDTFFYILGDQLGIDVLHSWLHCFGFGVTFDHLPLSTGTGLLPSKIWKSEHLKAPWYRGDSIQAAIGQGYVSATPLHLAYATALIASKGNTPLPQILKGQEPIWPEFIKPLQQVQCWDLIHQSMEKVIESPKGTAHRRLASLGLDIAGKTGTAQVISHQTQHRSQKKYRDHSLFMSYAPKRNPQIACVVIVENGSVAVPIAGELMQMILPELGTTLQKDNVWPDDVDNPALQSHQSQPMFQDQRESEYLG